jgi:hypothetical protein
LRNGTLVIAFASTWDENENKKEIAENKSWTTQSK